MPRTMQDEASSSAMVSERNTMGTTPNSSVASGCAKTCAGERRKPRVRMASRTSASSDSMVGMKRRMTMSLFPSCGTTTSM